MQLLYLWIENYKNIKQQGFNFSPLYDFHFEPTKEENGKVIKGTLTDKMNPKERKTKEKFYKDFFDVKNEKDDEKTQKGKITNVTAIVGENGAGKSSVLEMLNKISVKKSLNIKCLCIVRDFKNNYFIHKSKFTTIHPPHRFDGFYTIEDFENPDFYLPLNIISYSYQMKNFEVYKNYVQNKEKIETFIDISSNSLLYNIVNDNTGNILTNFEVQKIYDQCKFLHKKKIDLFKLNFLRLHIRKHQIYKSSNIDPSDKNEYDNHFGFYNDLFDDTDLSQPIYNISDFIDKIYLQTYISTIQSLSKYQRFKELKVFKKKNKGKNSKIIEHSKKVDDIILNYRSGRKKRFQNILNELIALSTNDKEINAFFYPQSKLKHLSELIKILEGIEKFNFQDYDGTLSISLENKTFNNFFEKYLELGFNLFDFNFEVDNQIQYLSTGEDAILFQLASFFKAQENIKYRASQNYEPAKFKEPYYILIDEGELGLHPQWQKQYLKILLETLPKIFPNKEIQLILTSHSPFLVSDLPKENVIFLRKGKKDEKLKNGENAEGKCIVDDTFKEQTFGQNIHTLFANSFFLENNGGLMGEFAKEKLSKLTDFINTGQPNEVIKDYEIAQEYIDRIGEPILKRPLQKKLFEKQIEDKEKRDKIALLRKMLKDLEE